MIDETTKLWMRNESDELAVANGCWFDLDRACWVVWWIEKYCPLYEGEWAGEHMLVRSGCEDVDWTNYNDWARDWTDGGREQEIVRAQNYALWIAEGNRGDWQYECLMRLFGWVKYSTRWKRNVRRFRRASIWIPKKQKKTPTLGAIGNYLIAGDGEQGAKCFGCAKDVNQASLAMAHAMAMVEQSQELSAECKINRNEKSIEHVPTRSKYRPLSSANERSKTSKEGINGHILIDETHVVDGDFVSIISRAGISRAEPLHIEVSTAGNNPDGYGKQQQDIARRVQSGEDRDDSLFVAIYEAPQDLSDTDLDLDPVKWGKLANPAWGHTAHEEEYLADYNTSKRTLSTLADFKMYRLNIWQYTASPWVKLDEWDACAGKLSDWSEADAVGAGVDLGSRDDFASLAFCARFAIAEDEDNKTVYRYEIRSYSYIASDSARDLTKSPFVDFVATGQLSVSKFPLRDLYEKLVAKCSDYGVHAVAYDPYNGQVLAEDLKSSGIIAARMAQNHLNFNEPISDLTQTIADGRFRHEGGSLLRWCARNAVLDKNKQNFRMFDKSKSSEKIDAIVAATMAFRMCCVAPERAKGSLYL